VEGGEAFVHRDTLGSDRGDEAVARQAELLGVELEAKFVVAGGGER